MLKQHWCNKDLLSMLGFLEVTFSNTQMRKCMAHRYSLLFDSNLLTHRIGYEPLSVCL